jgi:hypothetical protein
LARNAVICAENVRTFAINSGWNVTINGQQFATLSDWPVEWDVVCPNGLWDLTVVVRFTPGLKMSRVVIGLEPPAVAGESAPPYVGILSHLPAPNETTPNHAWVYFTTFGREFFPTLTWPRLLGCSAVPGSCASRPSPYTPAGGIGYSSVHELGSYAAPVEPRFKTSFLPLTGRPLQGKWRLWFRFAYDPAWTPPPGSWVQIGLFLDSKQSPYETYWCK